MVCANIISKKPPPLSKDVLTFVPEEFLGIYQDVREKFEFIWKRLKWDSRKETGQMVAEYGNWLLELNTLLCPESKENKDEVYKWAGINNPLINKYKYTFKDWMLEEEISGRIDNIEVDVSDVLRGLI